MDILCRIYHYHSKVNPKVISSILQSLPAVIERALVDVNIGTSSILRNMRPLLAEVNENNEHITSVHLKSFFIQKNWTADGHGDRYMPTTNWLDIEDDLLSFNVIEQDSTVMVRIKYHCIRRIHFATSTFTIQVFFC